MSMTLTNADKYIILHKTEFCFPVEIHGSMEQMATQQLDDTSTTLLSI